MPQPCPESSYKCAIRLCLDQQKKRWSANWPCWCCRLADTGALLTIGDPRVLEHSPAKEAIGMHDGCGLRPSWRFVSVVNNRAADGGMKGFEQQEFVLKRPKAVPLSAWSYSAE